MSVVKMVLDSNWAGLKEYCDKTVADKIFQKIEEKKVEVIAKLNRKSVDEMKLSINK